MKFCPIKTYNDLTQDDSGRPSMHKTTYFWGFIAMTGWITKLIAMGASADDAGQLFLVYGGLFVAGSTASKFIDAYSSKAPTPKAPPVTGSQVEVNVQN